MSVPRMKPVDLGDVRQIVRECHGGAIGVAPKIVAIMADEIESLRSMLAMLEHPAMGDDDKVYCAICTHYKPGHDPQCELAALLGGPR